MKQTNTVLVVVDSRTSPGAEFQVMPPSDIYDGLFGVALSIK
ncbi:hypothetical protein [Nostoc sp.]